MKKEISSKNIPNSYISGNTIFADLNSPKGLGEILFINPKFTVIGLNSLPYMLFSVSQFDENLLPNCTKEKIFVVVELVLRPTFMVSEKIKIEPIPNWINKFSKLEKLKLDSYDLKNLEEIKDLLIHSFSVENVVINDKCHFIKTLKEFKYLKELFLDQDLMIELNGMLDELNFKVSLIDDSIISE